MKAYRYTCQALNKGTNMQEILINAATILAICSPTAAVIAYSVYKGDFSKVGERPSAPDELELRRRKNETMVRHERRAAHERHSNNLARQKLWPSEK